MAHKQPRFGSRNCLKNVEDRYVFALIIKQNLFVCEMENLEILRTSSKDFTIGEILKPAKFIEFPVSEPHAFLVKAHD